MCGGVSGLCQVVGFGGNVSCKLLGSLSDFVALGSESFIKFYGAFHTLFPTGESSLFFKADR